MSNQNNIQNQTFEDVHWADNSAKKVLEKFPSEEIYTVASGITPSGIIHFGHFREIITSEFVRKSLEKKGKKTNFIYSWDSYDAFRKVPKNVPQEFEKYLRLPNSEVPDPFEKYDSYAEKWMQEAENTLEVFNFPIEFQRQHKIQTSGVYADDIKACLQNLDKIRIELDKFRDDDHKLAKDWFPLTVYSEKTGKDTTTILNYDGEYSITYRCEETGFENTIDFRKTPIIKLAWRLDWPMRWKHFGVTFEPGGKDHSSPGSSYDTGKEIIKTVFNREAPEYTAYNFVRMKGLGGKISSSDGRGATIADTLRIYTPEMILYLFASYRPNAEFDISFDLDVIKLYEDFDSNERLYFGLEEEKNPKKLANLKRIYELSIVNGTPIPQEMPFQPQVRHLVTLIQSNDFDKEKVKAQFKDEIKTDFDEQRFNQRFDCISAWIKEYAPDEMKFTIQKEISKNLDEKEKKILIEVREKLEQINDGKELFGEFRTICENNEISVKDFFKFMYEITVNKEKGPKLAGFMIENKQKMLDLLSQA